MRLFSLAGLGVALIVFVIVETLIAPFERQMEQYDANRGDCYE